MGGNPESQNFPFKISSGYWVKKNSAPCENCNKPLKEQDLRCFMSWSVHLPLPSWYSNYILTSLLKILGRKWPTAAQEHSLVTPHTTLTRLIQIAWGNQATGNAKYKRTVTYMGVLSTGKLKARLTDFPIQSWVCWPEAKPMVSFQEDICRVEMCPGFSPTCLSWHRCVSTLQTAVWPGNPSLNKHTCCTQTAFQSPESFPSVWMAFFPALLLKDFC